MFAFSKIGVFEAADNFDSNNIISMGGIYKQLICFFRETHNWTKYVIENRILKRKNPLKKYLHCNV